MAIATVEGRRAELKEVRELAERYAGAALVVLAVAGVATPSTGLFAGEFLDHAGLASGFATVACSAIFVTIGAGVAFLAASALLEQDYGAWKAATAATVCAYLSLYFTLVWTEEGRRYASATRANAPDASACIYNSAAAGCTSATISDTVAHLHGPFLAMVAEALWGVFSTSVAGLLQIYGVWAVLGAASGCLVGWWLREWVDAASLPSAASLPAGSESPAG